MKKLQAGDTIGIAAPSGAIEDRQAIERGLGLLEDCGYKTVLADNCFENWRGLAGKDEQRAAGLMQLFENPQVDAIISMRGGYGALRLIDKIDYDIVRANPKIFCGYSDSSILSAMFLRRARLKTFSGPMLQSDFGAENPSKFMLDNFFKAMAENTLAFEVNTAAACKAEGIVWGGNLSSIVSLCGQDFIPDEPFIFFTEDLNEPDYKIDKMMTQLMNIEKFRANLQAVVPGDFIGGGKWEEVFEGLPVPVAKSLKITHAADKITVPYGAKATLNENIFMIEY